MKEINQALRKARRYNITGILFLFIYVISFSIGIFTEDNYFYFLSVISIIMSMMFHFGADVVLFNQKINLIIDYLSFITNEKEKRKAKRKS